MSPSLYEVVALSSCGTSIIKFVFNWTGCGNGWSPDADIS